MAAKQNSYQSLGDGLVIGSHQAMTKLYRPKVILCRTILGLSSARIAEFFGVVGKPYIEGLRSAMIEELNGSDIPFCSWREIAERVKGRDSSDYI